MNASNIEPLSLSTFEPDRAFAPYLTTPRSLEACRLNGVNPVELVEVPIAEFHKDFPNDPDAAQRRFDRIDGARRRVLADVMKDWKLLVKSNWKPVAERPKSAHEAILQVPAEVHCTLLELQAQRFRKLEEDNWNAYNRILKLEVKKADAEVKNKKILEKHSDIQASNDALKKERQMQREQIMKEERERIAKKEADEAARIKELQEMDARYAQQQKEAEIQQRKMERDMNLKREADRVAREEYTKQMKNSILQNVESKINNKKKIREMRDKMTNERLNQFKAEKAAQLEERRIAMENKLQKAREDILKHEENERQATMRKIKESEDHRNKILEMRENQRKESHESNDNLGREKLNQIYAVKETITKEKQDKTLADLKLKETLAQQELDKVKQAQEKRKCIKSIRQESYAIAAARTRKANEYKMMKLEKDIKDKDERCNAIKKGFTVLNQMRNSMKDIMEKTTTELKHEMHRLRHTDSFHPDAVVETALEVSDQVLFPRLERTFGIHNPNAQTNNHSFAQSNNLFGFDFDKTATGKPSAPFEGTKPVHISNTHLSKSLSDIHPTPGPMKGPLIDKPSSPDHNTTTQSRTNFATLHIHSLTHDRLAAALRDSKERYTGEGAEKQSKPAYGTRGTPVKQNKGPKRRNKNDKSILKLDPEDYIDSDGDGDDGSDGNRGFHPLRRAVSPTSHKGSGSHSAKKSSSRGKSANSTRSSSSASRQREQKQQSQSQLQQQQSLPFFPTEVDEDGALSLKFSINGDHPVHGHSSYDDGNSTGGSAFGHQAASGPHSGRNHSGRDRGLPPLKSPNSAPGSRPSSRGGNSKNTPTKTRNYLKEKPVLRTDVNEKAKYMELPPGKFRREFSLDHPLAANGTGKYNKELKSGVTPQGMDVAPKADANMAATLATANKIERLTYEAQSKVVDPDQQLERIKKEQNMILKNIIDEEKQAEEAREAMGGTVTDYEEKERQDSIFAEERRRASERIIKATKEHENVIKSAVLAMMNLGIGAKDNHQ